MRNEKDRPNTTHSLSALLRVFHFSELHVETQSEAKLEFQSAAKKLEPIGSLGPWCGVIEY